MATIEVKETQQIQNPNTLIPDAIDVDYTVVGNDLSSDSNIGQSSVINPMNIKPELLYQTADEYQEAARKLEDLRDNFGRQAQQTEQEIIDLERLYNQSAQPLDTIKTTAATLAGAVLLPKALEHIAKNVYNPETMAHQAIDAAVDVMRKPLSNNFLINTSDLNKNQSIPETVLNIQKKIKEVVTNIAGEGVATAITQTTDHLNKRAAISQEVKDTFKALDKGINAISNFQPNGPINKLLNKLGVESNIYTESIEIVREVANKSKVNNFHIKGEIYDLADFIDTNKGIFSTKNDLIGYVKENIETIKNNVANTVPDTNVVDRKLLGKAKEIKKDIIEGISSANEGRNGMEVLAEKAKEDLKGNKIAEGLIWANDRFKETPPKVKTAIYVAGAVLGGVLAYELANEISKRRQENLNHIDEQIVATEEKKEVWIGRVGDTENKREQTLEASRKIRNIADWRTQIIEEKNNPQLIERT